MRKIIHVDMDAFFAAVEQRDRPELKGKPVIVGGPPGSRSVVAACSYEARKYGIHSAMPSGYAYKLCPKAIFVKGNFKAYKEANGIITSIFHEYTDLVEPLSIDEAYMDVTENIPKIEYASVIAIEIRKKIFKATDLTASAGISFNKFLAKVASDYNKPDGQTVVTPENAARFIDNLKIGKFYGVGKVTEKKMKALGIMTGADLKQFSREELKKIFGKVGGYYYDMANGIDDRPVNTNRIRKSIGKEHTLNEDITDIDEMHEILHSIALKLEKSLNGKNVKGLTVNLKVKFDDFESITRSISVFEPVSDAETIFEHTKGLLSKTVAGKRKVRLLGISISNFTGNVEFIEIDEQLKFKFQY
ncbi:DNA polymerase IV [bacterium]|nr:DNA polymerase IV [bacterium]